MDDNTVAGPALPEGAQVIRESAAERIYVLVDPAGYRVYCECRDPVADTPWHRVAYTYLSAQVSMATGVGMSSAGIKAEIARLTAAVGALADQAARPAPTPVRKQLRVVYVAGPFRSKTAWGVAENVRAAERVGMDVAAAGFFPLIPHANTAHFDGTLTDEFWLDATMELLSRCDALVTVPGWERSKGAVAEVAWCKAHHIPVFHAAHSLRLWHAEAADPTT